MNRTGHHILRVGIAITFLWISVLIFQSPEGWGRLIQPWALGLLPIPLKAAMQQTAVLDAVIGLFLLLDVFTFRFAALGLLHVITVLVVVGIVPETIRDVAIASGLIALMADTWPGGLWPRKRTGA